jgi:hypothetical protein
VEHLLDAGFYATVTILIDERSEGTPILRHDGKRSRFYRSSKASNMANSLDKKIKPLVVKKRPPSERWDHLMLLSSRTMLITIEGYFRDTGDGRLREL